MGLIMVIGIVARTGFFCLTPIRNSRARVERQGCVIEAGERRLRRSDAACATVAHDSRWRWLGRRIADAAALAIAVIGGIARRWCYRWW